MGGREKDEFFGKRLRPGSHYIDWPEPFGLVMIEALACGTPVIAWRNGSVPEVIADGTTGFVVDSLEEAVEAVGRVAWLDRATCRRTFEERFDASRMTRDYVEIYRRLVHGGTERPWVDNHCPSGSPLRTRRGTGGDWRRPSRSQATLLGVMPCVE